MRNLLFTFSVILVIIWAIGFFALSAGGIIHILPLIAAVIAMKGLFKEKELLYLKNNPTWKVPD